MPRLPELLGGSADLTGSNLTKAAASVPVTPEQAAGNYIFYGVREFGMTAVMNGIGLHGGFIPYGGTFLVFSDYARNALRMAALMQHRHDSRADPRLDRPRRGRAHAPADRAPGEPAADPEHARLAPGDGAETAVAWCDGHRAARWTDAAWC